MTVTATTLTTPIGELSLLARDEVLLAAGFAPVNVMATRAALTDVKVRSDLGPVSQAVAAYFDGDLAAVDRLAVDQPGGDFFNAAWKVMRDIPAGTTISYAELASRAGSSKAIRAAGSACARNLIALVIPCHRVVRSGDGRPGASLGGYYYGLPVKEWLLAHERRSAPAGR